MSESPILLDEVLKELLYSIQNKRIAILCGAGISYSPPSNLPTGNALKKKILWQLLDCNSGKKIRKKIFNKTDNILDRILNYQFEYFMSTLNNNIPIVDSIVTLYQKGLPNLTHSFIAQLLINGYSSMVLTTNFDTKIEEAVKQLNQEFESKLRKLNKEERFNDALLENDFPILIKLHGCISEPLTIRTTLDAVASFTLVEKRVPLIRYFFGEADHDILVLGYSFSDEYDVNTIVRDLKKITTKKIFLIKHSSQCDSTVQPLKAPLNSFNGYIINIHTEKIIRELSEKLGFFLEKPDNIDNDLNWAEPILSWVNSASDGLRLFTVASVLWDVRAWNEALSLYNMSIENYEKSGDQRGKANALGQIAIILKDKGNYDEAERYLIEIQKIFESLDDQIGIGKSLHQRGMILYKKGNYEKAEELFNAAIELYKNKGYIIGEAYAFGEIAAIRIDTGKYSEVEELTNICLQIHQNEGNVIGQAEVLHDLARLWQEQGKHDIAFKLLEQSLELRNRLGDLYGKSATLHHLGIHFKLTGDLIQAEAFFKEAILISELLGDLGNRPSSLLELAKIMDKKGDKKRVKELVDEAYRIATKIGDNKNIASSLIMLAYLHFSEQDLAAAERLYEKALKIFELIGDKKSLATTYAMLGLQYALNDSSKALDLLNEAAKIFDEMGLYQQASKV